MSLGNPGKQVVVDTFEAVQDGAFDVGKQLVGCLLSRFKEFMSNPALQDEVQAQFAANNMMALLQKEFLRGLLVRPPKEKSLWKKENWFILYLMSKEAMKSLMRGKRIFKPMKSQWRIGVKLLLPV